MDMSHRPQQWRGNAALLGILFFAPLVPLPAFGQAASNPTSDSVPAQTATSDAPTDEVVDLRTLVLRELRSGPNGERNLQESSLSIRGKSDGTVEVWDASGRLLQKYPPNHFYVSGKVNVEAIQKMNARAQELEKTLTERKEKEKAVADQEVEAAKVAEAKAKKESEENEIKWQENFTAKSTPYLDRKTNSELKAVKIDAREIAKDGTYEYEGKKLKPVRLWNTQRKSYEMAIPVPEAAK